MPKVDIAKAQVRTTSAYPEQFKKSVEGREKTVLGDLAGLTQFGVNRTKLPPGVASSLRHWHEQEDEFIYVLDGELTLVEDGGETLLKAGDCATFAKNSGNGHHLINRSSTTVLYLEVGSRNPDDVITCSDIDMMSPSSDGRFLHKDGRPYPGQG